MASYTVINTAQWAPPETSRYDGIDYRREDEEYSSSYSGPQYIRRNSVSVHRQPPSHDYYNDERGVEYTREASIKTPSIRSYQTTSGSYFPPAIKGREIRYEETRLKYPPQYGNIDNEVRDAGSLFSNLKIEDSYSARMDSGLYDNSDPTYPSRDYARREGDESVRYDVDDGFDEAEPTIPSRSRRHSIISSKSQIKQQPRQDWLPTPSTEKTEDEIRFEVDDVFDEAEDTVTADDWTMESNLRPGIASCGKEAVRVLRESEAINKDLRAVAAALAAFRAKRKQRPSFSGRSTSSSSKSKSSSSAFYTVKHKVDDRDRHRRDRHRLY